MPIPFTAAQSPLLSSLANGSSSSSTSSSSTSSDSSGLGSQRNGLSGDSGSFNRLQTQTLDSNGSRRWSRLQRRSPMDSNLSTHHHHRHGHHHSPRTRYLASFTPTNHPSSRTERQYQPQLHHPHRLPHQHQHIAGHNQMQQQQLRQHFGNPVPSSFLYEQAPSESHDRAFIISRQQRQRETPSPSSSAHLPTTISLSPPSARQTTSFTSTTTTASAPPPPPHPSPPRSDRQRSHHQHQQQSTLHGQRIFDPSMPMESSGPSDSIATFLNSRASAALSSHQLPLFPTFSDYGSMQQIQSNSSSSGSNSAGTNTMLSSTPMQRSLTHNPVMTSFSTTSSTIAAAVSDPASVSISVSSSSPVSSSFMPAISSHFPATERAHTSSFSSPVSSDRAAVSVTGDRESAANLNSNLSRAPHLHAREHRVEGTGSGASFEGTNRGQSQSNVSQSRSEVDDRIHFRLLNNIYFSASTRSSRHDDDLGMDSPVLSHASEQLRHMDVRDDSLSDQDDEYLLEDEMDGVDYEHTRRLGSMFTDHGDELASLMFRTRSNHPELIEEEGGDDDDDDDDGIDQVIESRRQRDAGAFSTDLELSLSPSSFQLERPQHAQLSPRSAAALTTMFSVGRSAWPQPIINSSISSDLIALSQRTPHEYDNNPYFRRPVGFPVRASSGAISGHRFETRSPLVRRNSIFESQFRAGGTGSTTTITPLSVATQYETIHPEYSSRVHLQESTFDIHRGCGENAPAPCTDTQGDVWPLKFEMYYADGGEFNATHSVENVLKNDTSVYCSRRPTNINICLKLSEPHQTFVLTQFKARAPTTGFTAPCKEGLIFVSHEPIALEKTAFFDSMTRERYEEYMESINDGPTFGQLLRSHGASADALVPAAFFQMDGPDETCSLDFTPNRSGRYVLIKLLRSRCTNSLQRPENIDLQYLGLIGFTGARSFASGGLL